MIVFCAPHVRVLTKMSLAERVDSGRFAFCVPTDVVSAASLVQSNVSSREETERIDMAKGQLGVSTTWSRISVT